MSSKTKIIVLRMKEIIYTALFIVFALFFILLLFVMLRPREPEASSAEETAAAVYAPGLYSSPLVLGSENANVEVAVSADRIQSVALVPLSDSVAAMYPLMQPSMDALASQIIELQSLEGIEYPSGSQYTSAALMRAVGLALSKAELPTE